GSDSYVGRASQHPIGKNRPRQQSALLRSATSSAIHFPAFYIKHYFQVKMTRNQLCFLFL
ncbi:unnamed protein product, partial [Larinioides sclopetarius]